MKRKIIVLLLVILLSGCSNEKTSITGDDFKKIVKDNKYEIIDVLNVYDYAKSAYLIKEDNYKIMFIEGKKLGDVQSTYTDEISNAYSNIYSDNKINKDKGEKWSYVELEDSDHYYYIIYINKTLLIVESNVDNKSEMINFINDLNYYK